MADKNHLVAYVGTYTYDGSSGLYVYDVKKDGQLLVKRDSFDISNPAYMVLSRDGEILYSIVDEGIAAFLVDQNTGDLTYMNTRPIGGMRGCFLDVDSQRRYVFLAGYHDGHVCMVKLKKDGSVSGVADSIFHLGHALSANERRLDHPKVSCVRLTPDEKYLCATDYGLNQMKVYKVDYEKGRLKQVDIVRCALDSAPRKVVFSNDGRFCYILTEAANAIEVFKYTDKGEKPDFELIERVPVIQGEHLAAASINLCFNTDEKYLFVAVDGVNQITWFERSEEDGTLTYRNSAPVSGDFPKFIKMLPDMDELMVLNHDTHEIRDFEFNFDKNYMLQCDKPFRVETPNCVCFKVIKG